MVKKIFDQQVTMGCNLKITDGKANQNWLISNLKKKDKKLNILCIKKKILKT